LTPLWECIPTFERTIEWAQEHEILWLEAVALRHLGTAILEQGRPSEGSDLKRRSEAIAEELGARAQLASAEGEWSIGELGLDAEGVERRVRRGYETLKAFGEKAFLSTVSANLAQVLYWRGVYDEAESLAVESESLGADEDLVTQVGWRAARAMVLAGRGRSHEAEALAREAVERAKAAEYFSALAESHLALAEVLRVARRTGEASEARERTLGVLEAKGCMLSAHAVRSRFAHMLAGTFAT
jgi:ATP/maltotriose-dependent transcriptional regulator MalT